MTNEQKARQAELVANYKRTVEEQTELDALNKTEAEAK